MLCTVKHVLYLPNKFKSKFVAFVTASKERFTTWDYPLPAMTSPTHLRIIVSIKTEDRSNLVPIGAPQIPTWCSLCSDRNLQRGCSHGLVCAHVLSSWHELGWDCWKPPVGNFPKVEACKAAECLLWTEKHHLSVVSLTWGLCVTPGCASPELLQPLLFSELSFSPTGGAEKRRLLVD